MEAHYLPPYLFDEWFRLQRHGYRSARECGLNNAPKQFPALLPSQNYYAVLGVDPDASTEEINKAYRRLALRWHPDKWGMASEPERMAAQERFKAITCAVETLRNKEKRDAYNRTCKDVPNVPPPMDMTLDRAFEIFTELVISAASLQLQQSLAAGDDLWVASARLVGTFVAPMMGGYMGGQAGVILGAQLVILLNSQGAGQYFRSLDGVQRTDIGRAIKIVAEWVVQQN